MGGTGSPRPSLLYAEDDERIASSVVEVLAETYDVDHCADGDRALALALGRRYDVIVLDRRLPGRDGDAVVEALRAARIRTPVLMLTALGSVHDRVSGLDAGANDYLVKPFEFDELLARLRALRRAFRADGRRRELGSWTFARDAQALYGPDGSRVALTSAETQLLDLLSESPDRVFSREAIVQAVFGAGSTANTVDTYVHYIRRKADPDLIETVRGRGYRAGAP